MKSNSLIAVLILLAVVLGCARFSRSSGTEPGASPTSKSPSRAGAAPTRSTGERGTPDEAKAMLQQAIAHYKDVGRQQALADFNAKKPPFGDRDLYVACIGPDHVLAANGGYPTLVGTSADGWKDADGQSLGKASYEAVASGGSGSIHYRWFNPISKKIEPKVLFVEKVGDDVCGVGAYNPASNPQ